MLRRVHQAVRHHIVVAMATTVAVLTTVVAGVHGVVAVASGVVGTTTSVVATTTAAAILSVVSGLTGVVFVGRRNAWRSTGRHRMRVTTTWCVRGMRGVGHLMENLNVK